MARNKTKGLTLIEMLMVIAIIGLLLSIATTSMAEYIAQTKLKTTLMSLVTHIRHAGMMAIGESNPSMIKFDTVFCSYTLNGTNEVLLPSGIRFGISRGISGSPGDPSTPPPADGISFDSPGHANTLIYYSSGYVVPAGTIYITDGTRTMAIRVANTGRMKLWSARGGKKWVEI
ncbi:MAG: prepilin-type N-terminal cleavage/methylation domain-containing protein [Nitrospirota bacterium]